jgi:Ca2+/Na+ antiporter
MPTRFGNDGHGGLLVLLALAAVTLYVASRTAAGALARGLVGRPGLRAVGHWIPVAVTSVVALRLGKPDVAVALAFSTSVAALSFVLGITTYIAPMDAPAGSRRAWPFVLPAALLALVAGFSGQLTALHAMAMLILGGAVYSAWREAVARGEAEAVGSAAEAAPEPQPPAWLVAAELALAVALAALGGWAAVALASKAAATLPLVSPRLVAVAVLTPLLALPMLATVPPERAAAHTSTMASTAVALTLLNLCLLLPLLTLYWHLHTGVSHASPAVANASGTHFLMSVTANAAAMPFPLATWRIDAVVLTVLGLTLVPVALGRWELGRWEAIGLVAGYALYLALSAAVSVRT